MHRLATFVAVFVAVFVTVFVEALAPFAAPRAAETSATPETGRVAAVIDGDTVRLESGLEVRLVGLQAPKLPLGRRGLKPWPLAEESRAALVRLVDGKAVALFYGGRRIDRHGRLLAHLHLGAPDGLWVQGAMLEAGMARVYSFADNTARVAEMLALERAARERRRGIWNLAYYAVRTPEETGSYLDRFEIVEGTVVSAADVRGRLFLNFGPDYREDFTVHIARRDARAFARASFDVLALEGRRIRVRGWLRRSNGPMIDATHPEQIEVLDDAGGAR